MGVDPISLAIMGIAAVGAGHVNNKIDKQAKKAEAIKASDAAAAKNAAEEKAAAEKAKLPTPEEQRAGEDAKNKAEDQKNKSRAALVAINAGGADASRQSLAGGGDAGVTKKNLLGL